MLRTRLGTRSGNPAFFDMACKFRPKRATWYGSTFRIGDRAAAYLYLLDWRARNPHRRLVVTEDPFQRNAQYSKDLTAKWLFSGIADEIWTANLLGEYMPQPAGEPLYTSSLWIAWSRLRHRPMMTVTPTLRAPVSPRVTALMAHVPKKYVTIQPLFDAAYDHFRNAPVSWWNAVCQTLATALPVVVLGAGSNSAQLTLPNNAHPLIRENLTPMESLSVIQNSALHIGGATGTTLWAGLFGRPVLACYKYWARQGRGDIRPLCFGATLDNVKLSCDPTEVVVKAVQLFQGAGA